jgi:hypothetical protein
MSAGVIATISRPITRLAGSVALGRHKTDRVWRIRFRRFSPLHEEANPTLSLSPAAAGLFFCAMKSPGPVISPRREWDQAREIQTMFMGDRHRLRRNLDDPLGAGPASAGLFYARRENPARAVLEESAGGARRQRGA